MTVHISDGLRIDDAFAARLVDRMLTELHKDTLVLYDDLKDARSSFGNPKGQRRIYNRILKRGHKSLLAGTIQTGTRCRFRLLLDLWDVTPSTFDGSGPLAWLVGSRIDYQSLGPGKHEDDTTEMAALSRHALERLVQRGAVKTSEDFTSILQRSWILLSLAIHVVLTDKNALPRDGETQWVLPIVTRDGTEVLLPIIRNRKPGPILIATTALTPTMGIDLAALEPLASLLQEYEGGYDIGKLVKDPRLVEAFKATAKATRKGRRQA